MEFPWECEGSFPHTPCTPESMWCDFQVFLLACNLATPCLGREPKARVATLFNCLMRSYLFNNLGDLQPQVTIYLKLVHIHQLHLLVFKNQPSHTNIHLVPINLKIKQLHLLNRLEELCHVFQKPSNQSIFIPHVELIEPRTTPIVVQQGVNYPQGT